MPADLAVCGFYNFIQVRHEHKSASLELSAEAATYPTDLALNPTSLTSIVYRVASR